MRLHPVPAIALLFALFVHPAGADAAGAPAWPATRAGRLAHGWVAAFSTGEDSMRTFIERNLAPRSLQERNARVRIEKYRTMRDQYGRLELVSVIRAKPSEVTVRLMDADAKEHEFVFAIQDRAPFKLVSVSIREQQAGIHGLFGGFHH
jgi:hypothetical protein